MRKYCSLIIVLIITLFISCQFVCGIEYESTLEAKHKEWCEKTFKNGKYIHEGYKDIAFNIKYTPESAKTDFWQTPFETRKSKKGDCEDAVFLFFSHLHPKQDNAEIVWGWVINNESKVARAHVWYQLKDKEGQLYVVEGFSNDWNGIIPMEIINQTESVKPILTIAQSGMSILVRLALSPYSLETYMRLANLHGSGDFIWETLDDENVLLYAHSRNDSINKSNSQKYLKTFTYKEVILVFKKLHTVFYRYVRQIEKERK